MKTKAAERRPSSTNTNLIHKRSGSQPFFQKNNNDGGQVQAGTAFFPSPVQAKLKIGRPDDKYEREADTIADKVVSGHGQSGVSSAPVGVQNKCMTCGTAAQEEKVQAKPLVSQISPLVKRQAEEGNEEDMVQAKMGEAEPVQRQEEEEVQAKFEVQRQEGEEEEVQAKMDKEEPVQRQEEEEVQAKIEEEPIQTKSIFGKTNSTASVEQKLQASKGQGNLLSDNIRAEMESGFGIDLGHIRIHTGSKAVQMSQALRAQAFTNGNDIYFNKGKYNPSTTSGKKLLAHELTHTVQQRKAIGGQMKLFPKRSFFNKNPLSVLSETPRILSTAPMFQQTSNKPNKLRRGAPNSILDFLPSQNSLLSSVAIPPKVKESPEKREGAGTLIDHGVTVKEGGSKTVDALPSTLGAAKRLVVKETSEDEAYQEAKREIGENAHKQKRHESAEQKRDELVGAAHLTDAEQKIESGKLSRGEELKSASEKAKRQPFDAVAFKQKLKDLIKQKEVIPKSEDEADKFPKSGKLDELKTDFGKDVGNEKDRAASPVKQIKEAPLPSGKSISEVPVPAAKRGVKPPIIDPKKAVPKPRAAEEISLQHESDNLDDVMTQNELTDNQLGNSNEPKFLETLKKKNDAQKEIAAAPENYQEKEQTILEGAGQQADQKMVSDMARMLGRKNRSTKNVHGGQKKKEKETEDRQREIKGDIDGFYNDTVSDVQTILDVMTQVVNNNFSVEIEFANKRFKDNVRSRLDDHYGWFTWDDKLSEALGLSKGVQHIFDSESALFTSYMDLVLDDIALKVVNGLNAAQARIDLGRQKMIDYKATLKGDEAKFAGELLEMAETQFQNLENSIDNKHEELLDGLATQYNEVQGDLQKEFDSINEELRKSWIEAAIDFIIDVGKAIYKLGKLLVSIVVRMAAIINDILAHPIDFFTNLVKGVKQAIKSFSTNIADHLKTAFWTWLTGATKNLNVQIPEKWDFKGLLGFAAQIVQIGKQELRRLAIQVFGEKVVEMVEKGVALGEKALEPVRILLNEGIGGLWNYLKETMSTAIDGVVKSVKESILYATINKALQWVAGLFIPGAAFIKAIQAIYKALRWLVDNIDHIVEMVNSILDSLEDAVRGNVGGIVKRVIKAITKAVVIGIDFLAKLVGIGGLSQKVQKAFKRLRKPILNGIRWVLKKAKKVLQKIGFFKLVNKIAAGVEKGKDWAKEKVDKVKDKVLSWWLKRKPFTDKDGAKHQLYIKGGRSNARLMVASTVMVVGEAIKLAAENAQTPREKQAITNARTLKTHAESIIERLQGNKTGAYDPKDIQAINDTLNQLADEMKILIPIVSGPVVTSPGALSVVVGDLISYGNRYWVIASFKKVKYGKHGIDMINMDRVKPTAKSSNAKGLTIEAFDKASKNGSITIIDDKKSRRLVYMGTTPRKNSDVGKKVKKRMISQNKFDTANSKFLNTDDGKWYPLSKADMGHIIGASVWWNSNGRFKGAQSSEVLTFMKDPDNYEFEESDQNRRKGASAPNYLPPVT